MPHPAARQRPRRVAPAVSATRFSSRATDKPETRCRQEAQTANLRFWSRRRNRLRAPATPAVRRRFQHRPEKIKQKPPGNRSRGADPSTAKGCREETRLSPKESGRPASLRSNRAEWPERIPEGRGCRTRIVRKLRLGPQHRRSNASGSSTWRRNRRAEGGNPDAWRPARPAGLEREQKRFAMMHQAVPKTSLADSKWPRHPIHRKGYLPNYQRTT